MDDFIIGFLVGVVICTIAVYSSPRWIPSGATCTRTELVGKSPERTEVCTQWSKEVGRE